MERLPSHRLRGAAVALPVLGLFLWLPPFVTLFTGPLRPFGVPLIVIYIFGVWAGLVLAAAWLARRLRVPAAPGGTDAAAEPGAPS
jgi:hypothetical protein